MPIKRKQYKLPVENGQPIRCMQMVYPGNRQEIYVAVPDIEQFLESQRSPAIVLPQGILETWQTLQDLETVGLSYYHLSVLPWLINLKAGNAPVRDRMIRLIKIACKQAENLTP